MAQFSIDGVIQQRLGDNLKDYLIPPPIFETMKGEFLTFDSEARSLTARFPVLGGYLNPFGSMQGGMVAAAIDNTLGPLSMLVAPPNVTRRLNVKFSHPVTPDAGYIVVEARLVEHEGRRLTLVATARDPQGMLLARARAMHWIVGEDEAA